MSLSDESGGWVNGIIGWVNGGGWLGFFAGSVIYTPNGSLQLKPDCLGVGVQRREGKGLFCRHAYHEQAESIGHGQAYFLQGGSGLSFGAFVDAGTDNGTMGHGGISLLSYIVAQYLSGV